MELRFDVILYSKLGNENSDVGHIKCSRGVWATGSSPLLKHIQQRSYGLAKTCANNLICTNCLI